MGHGHQQNVYGVLDFLAMAQFRLNGTLSYPNIMHNKIHYDVSSLVLVEGS